MTTPDPTRPELQRLIAEASNAIAAAAAAALAAAPADGPAVPEGSEPASVNGEPSDEELTQEWQPLGPTTSASEGDFDG